MSRNARSSRLALWCTLGCFVAALGQTPDTLSFGLTNRQPVLQFAPAPATLTYWVEAAPSPQGPFAPQSPPTTATFTWQGAAGPAADRFYRVRATPIPGAKQFAANLLNRIAYGPVPGDLDQILSVGPATYLEQQLAPESIAEDLDHLPAAPAWRFVSAVGAGSSSTQLLFFLTGPADVYLDDVRLVAGVSDDGSQANLVADGGFEDPLAGNWSLGTSVSPSARSAAHAHGGKYSLHLVASDAGGTTANSLAQSLSTRLAPQSLYTFSFWYLPATDFNQQLRGVASPGLAASAVLTAAPDSPAPLFASLAAGNAYIDDLRAWHIRSAIQSKRQLAEVLRQFLENHFVTEYSKSADYLFGAGQLVGNDRAAVGMEFQENLRWREALLNPQVTFYDLLRISAESPAMVIYLDTAASRGDNGNIANENYARELNELFCFGVNNGYDQNDIVQISRVWSGWNIEFVATNEFANPFARRSTNLLNPNALSNRLALTNLVGGWAFNYKPALHNTSPKHIFMNWAPNGGLLGPKTVPARFGPPWAGRDYSLNLIVGGGTNSIQEGYQLLQHMANQPFTEEFISVKLCRLLVHDNFQIGYDFTSPSPSPEGRLIHDCMLAWENPPGGGPQGQLRAVLRVILNSTLFASNASCLQKVKTPLEYAVSLVRAFRAPGSLTATADGYSIAAFLNRAGAMNLFDRQSPDGYPEDGVSWVSAGTLAERIRFAQAALLPTGSVGKDDAAGVEIDPVALLAQEASNALTDGGAAADYFLGLLFPGEGAGNLAAYRQASLEFLNTSDDGATVSPLSQLTPGSNAYATRMRAFCAWLLSSQRFNEQ